MGPDGLAEWLNARLDELARRALSLHDLDSDCEIVLTASESGPCTCGVPDLVLADIATKRAILNFLDPDGMPEGEGRYLAAKVLHLLGSAYADREGYDEAWRP